MPLKIVAISDTHCRLSKIKIPDGDLLVHTGDLTFSGNITEVSQEANQLDKIKSRFTHGIVFVPGNHDWLFQRNEALAREIMGDVKVLIDETVTIDGINIYGSPWQPEFCDWAFNLPRGEPLKEKWDAIPASTNILLTHGPAFGLLDECPDKRRVGCEELYKKVMSLPNLSHHIFGHIHHSYGIQQIENKTFINASICTEHYKPTNKPIIFHI